MIDTPLHIHKKQLEIFLKKPIEERFQMGMEMIDDMKRLIEGRIRTGDPEISEIRLRIEVFKEMYGKDMSEDYLNMVVEWFESTVN